jgi:threonine/homoserine/homoserine lactone efflux protein
MPGGAVARTVRGVLVFVAASAALVAIPGPNVLFVLARGLSGGRRAAVVSVLGVESATACFVAAAALGLTALLVSSAVAFAVVRYAGAVYLLVLAVRALRSGPAEPAPVPAGRTFRQAFLVGISNPKVAVFFLAFLPQFVSPGGSAAEQVLLLGLVFLAVATTADLGWALLSGQLGRWLRRHPSLLRRQRFLTAPLYAALAGYAAAS